MKISVVFFFLIVLHLNSWTQTTLESSVVTVNLARSLPEKMIGADDEYFYLLSTNTQGKGINFFIEKYNKENYNLQYSKNVTTDENTNDLFIDAFFINGQTIIFRDRYEQSDNATHSLYAQIINSKGEILNNNLVLTRTIVPKPLMGVSLGGAAVKEASVYNVYSDISVSENGKYIMITTITKKI